MTEEASRYKRYAQIVALGARHDFGWLFDQVGLGRFLSSGESADKAQGTKRHAMTPELGKSLLGPKELVREIGLRLIAMEDVLIDLPPLTHRVLGRLDAGKLSLRVEQRLDAASRRDIAGMVLGACLCVLGMVGAVLAVLLRGVTDNGHLGGYPFWPAAAALGAAASFLCGGFVLWRIRSRPA